MKLAKSHKIILMITAIALSVMLAFCALNVFNSKAAGGDVSSPSASNYFTGGKSAEFVDGQGAKVTFETDKRVAIKSKLAIDDAEITFSTENVSTLKMILTYDSFYVNGNKNAEGKFVKEIENTFDIGASGSVKIAVENNQVKVNASDVKAEDYYKIRKVDKAVAKIEFEATALNADSPASITFSSINQDATNAGYNQSFVLVDSKLQSALPKVNLDADIFVRDALGNYELKTYEGQGYSLSYTALSVLGNVSASDLYPTAQDNVTIPLNNKNEKQDFVHFKTDVNSASFNVCYKNGDSEVVCQTYNVTVFKADENVNLAPKYNLDDKAIEAFKAELEKQYYVLDDNGEFKLDDNGNKQFVPLGTEIEIPSMEDMVYDDRTPYDKLQAKLYYIDRDKHDPKSDLELTLTNVGEYYFYVVFSDFEDKSMDADQDFFKLDDDGNLKYDNANNVLYGDYKGYIFNFEITEDTEIVVTAPSKQGNGYKGTKYTASKFEITSSNCDITYTLEYATSLEAGDWKEIKKFSDIEEGYSDDNYDYETLKAINYNGEYTFTPDKVGVYRITVNVASKMSFMSNSASTIITVGESAKVITPSAFDWIKDNVWSVVFLSVGTLCLIGVIVLLCIKPKDKTDED